MRVSSVDAAVVVLAVAMIGFPSSAAAQAGRADVQEGNRLYHEGRYDEAHEKYLEALRAAPDSPLIRFNDANALYQSEEFARAVDAYRGAIEAADPMLEAQAWYNLGNALYRQREVEGALEAYKEALRRDPGDTDAKHNLEVALEQLQQQQQQEQSGDPQQNQDQQESQEQPPGEQPPEEDPEGQRGQDEQEERPGQDEQEERQPDTESSEPDGGDAEARPQPGEMSREEVERLLQAITEDPGQIRRQRRAADPGRRTRRPW